MLYSIYPSIHPSTWSIFCF